jgi:hypothetical protein
MSSNANGGFILTTTNGSSGVLTVPVNIDQLNQIAKVLNIPPLDKSTQSIYVFRGSVGPHVAQLPPGGGSKAG